ncbi:MAG: glycosyltransferase [Thermosphaera sp.]
MRNLHIGDHIRHELGCAASLKERGFDVTYLHLGNKNFCLRERNVYIDGKVVKIKFAQVVSPSFVESMTKSKNFIPSNIIEEKFDVVITTPQIPFHLAYYIARRQNIPLILRIWGIRANKLIDFIIYGKSYSEVLNFWLSTMHNFAQVWSSQAVIAMDDSTKSFLNKLLFKRAHVVYPTYAALYDENNYEWKEYEIKELIKENEYVFSIVMMQRSGSTFRLQESNLFKILYIIAKKCPEINVIIAGSTATKIIKRFGLSRIPKNLIFTGSISSDNILKILYEHASMVIIPVFFRSLSNRLLEALYYKRPILTNSYAKLLHNKLEHLRHIFISDNYSEYPNIVRELVKNEALLEELAIGAKEAYDSFFSARNAG